MVVSDRAKKATLARLLSMDAMVIVMPQEQLAKTIRENTHRENCQRTPQKGIVRAKQHGCIPKGTQRARTLVQGERSPGASLILIPGSHNLKQPLQANNMFQGGQHCLRPLINTLRTLTT